MLETGESIDPEDFNSKVFVEPIKIYNSKKNSVVVTDEILANIPQLLEIKMKLDKIKTSLSKIKFNQQTQTKNSSLYFVLKNQYQQQESYSIINQNNQWQVICNSIQLNQQLFYSIERRIFALENKIGLLSCNNFFCILNKQGITFTQDHNVSFYLRLIKDILKKYSSPPEQLYKKVGEKLEELQQGSQKFKDTQTQQLSVAVVEQIVRYFDDIHFIVGLGQQSLQKIHLKLKALRRASDDCWNINETIKNTMAKHLKLMDMINNEKN